jgi:hypothetical protein
MVYHTLCSFQWGYRALKHGLLSGRFHERLGRDASGRDRVEVWVTVAQRVERHVQDLAAAAEVARVTGALQVVVAQPLVNDAVQALR